VKTEELLSLHFSVQLALEESTDLGSHQIQSSLPVATPRLVEQWYQKGSRPDPEEGQESNSCQSD